MVYFFLVNFFLFFFGSFGLFLVRRNLIITLMSLEIMFLSISLNFLLFSSFLGDVYGHFFALSILTVAAADSSIALGIILVFYRHMNVVSLETISNLSG